MTDEHSVIGSIIVLYYTKPRETAVGWPTSVIQQQVRHTGPKNVFPYIIIRKGAAVKR